MATTDLVLTQSLNNKSVTLTDADTTVARLLFTAGASGSLVKAIIATSDDTAAVGLKIYVTRSAVDYLLGALTVATLAGTDGIEGSCDLLTTIDSPIKGLPKDNVGKTYISLAAGDTLKIGCLVTMTAAKVCTVNCFGENF